MNRVVESQADLSKGVGVGDSATASATVAAVAPAELKYQSGFGNHFASEALELDQVGRGVLSLQPGGAKA